MKRFRFRLEKLKKLRADNKRHAQRRFARAMRQEHEESRKLQMLREETKQHRVNDRQRRVKRVIPGQLRRAADYIGQLEFLIKHQIRKVAEAQQQTLDRLKELEETSKEEKKFKRLEEIQRENYNISINRFLQKETDEIASQIGIRRNLDSSVITV